MRKLTLADVNWATTAEPDGAPVRGNCSAIDDETDRVTEDAILARLDSGDVWAWAIVAVTGRWNGLEHTEYLGGCCYEDAADFERPGGYYDDMRAEVLDQLQEQAEQVARGMCPNGCA